MIDVSPSSIATQPLPLAVRTLWRFGVVAFGVVLLVAAVVAGLAVGSAVLLVVLLAVAFPTFAVRWWVVERNYANWRWGLDGRWIERRSGVIVRTTQVVPRSRVQTLTTRTGPLDRWLGLSSIVVHTAGTHTPNLTIPHLDSTSAEHIRAELGG